MKYIINVRNKSTSKHCIDSKNLMDSLTVYQDLAPRACHNGACGLCRIKVYSGECRTNKMNRKFISIEDEWKSIFLACRVFPLSDMDIEFLPKIIKENKDKPVYRFGN